MNCCRYGVRHWFAYYGMVGSSSPTCRRCGAENPNYRPADDPKREASAEPDDAGREEQADAQ